MSYLADETWVSWVAFLRPIRQIMEMDMAQGGTANRRKHLLLPTLAEKGLGYGEYGISVNEGAFAKLKTPGICRAAWVS